MYQGLPSGCLKSENCELQMRQQPKEALVTTNKPKTRKPVDPPPVVHLENRNDPNKDWQRNPNLFMIASLASAERDEPYDNAGNPCLIGNYTSSCQRLRDEHGEEGAFFVFPDLSVRVVGQFRIRFTLFECLPNFDGVQCLSSTLSEEFKVSLPKNFGGLQESSFLSRTFADQGVKLRLRKENNKRTATEANEEYDDEMTPPKRVKPSIDDRKDSFPESSNARMPTYHTTFPSAPAPTNYAAHRQPDLSHAVSYSSTELQPNYTHPAAMAPAIAQAHDYWHRQPMMMQETNRYPQTMAHAPNSHVMPTAPFSGPYGSIFPSYGDHPASNNARDYSTYAAPYDGGDHPYVDL
jgi:hypothetical protein